SPSARPGASSSPWAGKRGTSAASLRVRVSSRPSSSTSCASRWDARARASAGGRTRTPRAGTSRPRSSRSELGLALEVLLEALDGLQEVGLDLVAEEVLDRAPHLAREDARHAADLLGVDL